jgi:GTP-binding protein
MPLVAIVGRANVGKSSIFNRLLQQRRAIVAKEAGTTRDAVIGTVSTKAGVFNLMDTAGLKTAEDDFEQSIQQQVSEAAAAADLIVVTVDAQAGLLTEDRQAAKLARKSGKPLLLAVNKAEHIKHDNQLAEFYGLGIEPLIRLSAGHNQGLDDLLAAIMKQIKPAKEPADAHMTLALVGRPNAGKSSLFNALGNQNQAIVSATAGTTRDVNRLDIKFEGQKLTLLDTAGIRRPGKIEKGIEKFSVARALAAVAEADAAALVIDATEPGVALEQKLAGQIKDAGKGLILVVTKWDLMDKDAYTHDQLMARLREQFQHVPWAMAVVASAVSKQNLTRLLILALEIKRQRLKQLKTAELNQWLSAAVTHQPPAGLRGVQPKLKYAVQTGSEPPEITVFGRNSRVLHWSYKRYLERTLRQRFDFAGTPVLVGFRDERDKVS